MNDEEKQERREAALGAEREYPQTFAALQRIRAACLEGIAQSKFSDRDLREQLYSKVQVCDALERELFGVKLDVDFERLADTLRADQAQ